MVHGLVRIETKGFLVLPDGIVRSARCAPVRQGEVAVRFDRAWIDSQDRLECFDGLLETAWAAGQLDAHADDLGISPSFIDETLATPAVRAAVRAGTSDARVTAIGRHQLETKGVNNSPLEELAAMTRDTVRQFAATEVAPIAEHIHRHDDLVPDSLIDKMGELGFFGMAVPEAYGGGGMGNLVMIVTTEELSAVSLAAAGSLITRPEILTKALFEVAPEADAGRDRVWGVDIPLTFDGSGSFHPDPFRQIVLYEWDFDGDGFFDSSSTDPTAEFTYTRAEYPEDTLPVEVTVTLRVTDDKGKTDTDTALITIAVPPHPPVADVETLESAHDLAFDAEVGERGQRDQRRLRRVRRADTDRLAFEVLRGLVRRVGAYEHDARQIAIGVAHRDRARDATALGGSALRLDPGERRVPCDVDLA